MSQWNGRFSITITLATAICLLVLVAVGSVLGVGVWLAQKNTIALLSANAHQGVSGTVDQIKQHLRPAEHQARFIAERINKGEIDPSDRKAFGRLLIGALAAAPQIEAVMFIDLNLQSFAAGREREKGTVSLQVVDYARDPDIRKRMAGIEKGPRWTSPIWRDQYKKTYLNLAFPVVRNAKFIGAVVAVVSVRKLSDFARTAGTAHAGHRFILYGRDHVLAHPLLVRGYPGRTSRRPLPALAGFRDRALAAIWQREDRYELQLKLGRGTEGHVIQTDDEEFVFVYQRVSGFGPRPLIVGAYFRAADVGTEMRRMLISLFAGIGALIISLVAAVFLGRHIGRPIAQFSAAASRIRDLEVAKVEDVPGSVFRELNNQSIAFNAMLRALRWFELYVPKKIVERLIKQGDIRETSSSAREITVMFTDIVGFSTTSEGMSAPEVAAFVNRHFELVAGCIEAEDGTVDKFIGDSVMAFWGAPDRQRKAAARACRAALAIADAIRSDNVQRRAAGESPVGIRIGIHTGNATVGNIGAPGRINYTIIGDSVNVGQRLEQLGKEVYPAGTEVSILISGETERALGAGFKTVAAGRFKLKGRAGEVQVFKLA